jgi:acetyltransferase-like isoleucine patch superfamily enzyme
MGIPGKLSLKLQLLFLRLMQQLCYDYYRRHFPRYLKRLGVRFSGDIEKAGFVAADVSFDSIDYARYITLGERVIISEGVKFLVHDYAVATALRGCGKAVQEGNLPHFLKPIRIGSNCFIGARSILLPGTVIGDNCIIGAGSVVRGTIPSGSVVLGNPAVRVKSLEEYAAACADRLGRTT